jgi:hypothetical protein
MADSESFLSRIAPTSFDSMPQVIVYDFRISERPAAAPPKA